MIHHTDDSNHRIQGNLLLPVNSLHVDVFFVAYLFALREVDVCRQATCVLLLEKTCIDYKKLPFRTYHFALVL